MKCAIPNPEGPMSSDLQRPRPEATRATNRAERGYGEREAREPVGWSLFVAVILLTLLLSLA